MVDLRAENLARAHRRGSVEVRALDGVSLTVSPGELVTISGPSGSGKSTLLHLLGLLDAPTSGAVLIDGVDAATRSDDERARYRRSAFGFVFQAFHLLAGLSAWENVALPALLDGLSLKRQRARATELLDLVGLGERADHAPHELSGGEQQRVAIARALMAGPSVVFADEPTGALDQRNAADVVALLRALTVDVGRALVIVTHEPTIAATPGATRLQLRDGRLVGGPVAT